MNLSIERAEFGTGYIVTVCGVKITVTRTQAEARKFIEKKLKWRERYGQGNFNGGNGNGISNTELD